MKDKFEEFLKEEFNGFPSYLDMEYSDMLGCYKNEKTDFMFFGFCNGYWKALEDLGVEE